MGVNFLQAFRENFGYRVFAGVAVLICVISLSFTFFSYRHESKSLTENLISRGKLLAKILADSSRIGVFSENENLLKDTIDAVFQQEGVVEVSVFNQGGELLKSKESHGGHWTRESSEIEGIGRDRIFSRLRNSNGSLYQEGSEAFEFWSPVISGASYSMEESLFLGNRPAPLKDYVIGFVRITVDKKAHNERLNALLFKSALIGVIFLIIGSVVTYFVVKGITRPLDRLTEGAIALGRGGVGEKVVVETQDQIGRLARAFNSMSESLKQREGALRGSEGRLRFLSSQLLKAQEKERKRISKGLHDELGQALALLKHRLRSIQRKLPVDSASGHAECEETSLYIDQIIENVRRLSRDLSPSILEDLGLSAALQWLVENFTRQYPVEMSLDIEPVDHLFSKETQTNLYRVFQEVFTNIGKHADARHVSFAVKKNEGRVSFFVEDDGKGFDVNEVKGRDINHRGMGLAAIEERARILGADLNVTSRPGEGTRISMKLPVTEGGMG